MRHRGNDTQKHFPGYDRLDCSPKSANAHTPPSQGEVRWAANTSVIIQLFCSLSVAFEARVLWALEEMFALQVELRQLGASPSCCVFSDTYLHVCPGKQKLVAKIILPLPAGCVASMPPDQGEGRD